MGETYVPARGDVVWVDLNPRTGREQAGRRPALVVSPARYNGTVGLAIMCPITAKVKGYPFEVVLPGDLAVSGAVLSDQVKSLDWRERGADLACRLPKETVREVLGKLGTLVSEGGR